VIGRPFKLGINPASASEMLLNLNKSRLSACLAGFFSCVVSFSVWAGLPFHECERYMRSGWFRFDSNMRMPGGPLRGRELADATPSPALRVLTANEHRIFVEHVPDDVWAVSNFITKSGPSLAWIPKVAPKKVTLVREHEPGGSWHLMLRLQFPKGRPILHWTQNMDGLLGAPGEMTDVLIDFGAHRLKGEERKPYGYMQGLVGRYALQARMGSTAFKARMVRKDQREIVEYAMAMPAGIKLRLLELFIERTGAINRGEMYHTISNNCATAFQVLLEASGFLHCPSTRSESLVHGAVSWIPSGLLWSLRQRGVAMGANPHALKVE